MSLLRVDHVVGDFDLWLGALWAEAGARLGLEDPTARVLEEVESRTY